MFLPQERQGEEQFDFVCVSGDAYVDHPSFGIAVIARLIESLGFSVAILAQPDCRNLSDFMRLGKPRYGFFVTSGNVDSMVAHYTTAKRLRSSDYYSPGGVMGKRPDRAVTVYCNKLKACYPDVPVVIGGLEASLRRFAHYDYWSDTIMPSILCDAPADLLVFGMGERQTDEIARRLAAGESIGTMRDIRGTCYLCHPTETPYGAVECKSLALVRQDKKHYAQSVMTQMKWQDAVYGRTLIQRQAEHMLVQNPPMPPLTTEELDAMAELPYERYYPPVYEPMGGVPAILEVEFSIIHNRGCFGGCHFCAIAFHQGRQISVRSEESVLSEATRMTKNPRFKGYLHDVGGPTANFRVPSCQKQQKHGMCPDRNCLAPTPCKALQVDHTAYRTMLGKIRAIPGVKRVFIRSGIRYDYLLQDQDESFFDDLVAHHVSGQLKVAPEHCVNHVLDHMGKPHIEVYLQFMEQFYQKTKAIGKEQYLVPYLISSHPGSTLADAVAIALFLKQHRIRPEQVQDFYPTPGTLSTCAYYTGLDPQTGKPIHVAKTPEEKAMGRACLQYFMPKNHELVRKALHRIGRSDLIGVGDHALVPPAPRQQQGHHRVAEHKPSARDARRKQKASRKQTGRRRKATPK